MRVVIYSDDGNVVEFKGDTCIVTSGNQTYIGGITEASEIFGNILLEFRHILLDAVLYNFSSRIV